MNYKSLGRIDVLILGGGLAGMYAAIHAAKAGQNIMIISKGKIGLSGSSLVSMSVHRYAPKALTLKEAYRKKMLLSGHGINSTKLIDLFVQEGALKVEALAEFNLPLEFKSEEFSDQYYHYLACCSPKYGRNLTVHLRGYISTISNIIMLDGYMAVDLIIKDKTVIGAILEKDNELYLLEAKSIVLATGGAGYIYKNSSNTADMTGDGYAIALRSGLALQDMEFIQFYPYKIYSPKPMNIFPDIFEHGARFLNELGYQFMSSYSKKELENRDILARCMYYQKEVILDLSNCDQNYLAKECPDIYEAYIKRKDAKFLVKPVAHFMMGGIPLETNCSTSIHGLFCCGEVSGGLHGANRLAGSALTETAIFGPIAGKSASRYAERKKFQEENIIYKDEDVPAIGEDNVLSLTLQLRQIMWNHVSVVRSKESLKKAEKQIEELKSELFQYKPSKLRQWFECRNMILTAKSIINSAQIRQESRGAHYRSDYPSENDDWIGNIMSLENKAFFRKK